MKLPLNGNLGLRILALVIAIVIYYSMKHAPTQFQTRHEGNSAQQP